MIDFHFKATSNIEGNLKDLRGKWVVLYFYPRDKTPMCKHESLQFKALHDHFSKFNATIFGISKDSLKSHENFKETLQLPFELISDQDCKISSQFDVRRKSSLIEKWIGIKRSTFLISPKGEVVYEWRKVHLKDHAQKVLEKLKSH